MRLGELIPLIGALLNVSLAVFVLLQNPRAAVSRIYFLLGLSIAVWKYGTFWMFRVPGGEEYYQLALYWARFSQFGVIFIPLTLCHVSFLIAKIPIPKPIVWAAYSPNVLLFLSNFANFFLAGVKNVGYAWYPVAGTGFWILSGTFSLMWVSVIVLILHRRNLPQPARHSLTLLIIAQTIFSIFGCNDMLPIMGIYYYPGTNYQVYPFGSMAAMIYAVIVGYGVLQYQLLDVRVTMNRSGAKVVRVFFIFLTGLCALLVFWLINPQGFTFYSFFAGLSAVMIAAICSTILFRRP